MLLDFLPQAHRLCVDEAGEGMTVEHTSSPRRRGSRLRQHDFDRGLLVGGRNVPLALAELGLIDEYEFNVQPRLARLRAQVAALGTPDARPYKSQRSSAGR